MSVIKEINIEQFRGMHNKTIKFNRPVNAIIGKNGAMKTTLLGMIAHPFSLKRSTMASEHPLSGGKLYNSPMLDKFKFSDKFDIPGEHKWTLTVEKSIYPKEKFTCVSEKRSDNGKMRFWSTEGREKGMNFIQCPVIYLSMKRLIPVGEESELNITASQLTEEEKIFYIKAHNMILISTDNIRDISKLESTNKKTIGPITDYADAATISAGQDNIGRIILSVLSMKRLHDKFPNVYKGGIICIDELESTLYPASQEKIVEYMYRVAEDYKIQFFFTTHSMTIINYLKTGKNNERNSITYLKKVGSNIEVSENPSLNAIKNDLNVSAGKDCISTKIKVYCEDETAKKICKALLPKKIKNHVEFVEKIDLGWTNYTTLISHKIPEFTHNIVVLDGDVKIEKNRPKSKNVLFLPGDVYPERLIYEMLFNKKDDDKFWDNTVGGYDKNACFRNNTNYIEYVKRDKGKKSDTDQVKIWFKELLENKNINVLFREWRRNNIKLTEDFVSDFVKSYNYVAALTGFEKISLDES